MEKDFLSCKDIAELMGIEISTVRAYCKRGKIPSLKVGRSYRVAAKDFYEWFEEGKRLPPDADKRRYLKKLKESEQKYKNLISQSLDGIIMTDFKGSLLLANPSFCKMLDYSEQELLSTNLTQHIHSDERAQAVEDHMRRMAGEVDPQPKAMRLLRKDGKTVFAELLGGPVWEAGKIAGVQMVLRDITWRKKLEQELETIIDLVPDALMITDFNGRIYRVNKSVEQFSGYTREELFSMDSVVNMYHYPEERARALGYLKERGEFHNFEFTASIKGTLMPAEMSAKVVEIGGEKYIESLVRDITERKQLQDQLKATKEILERTFNAVGFGILHLDPKLHVLFANEWTKARFPDIEPGKKCHVPFKNEDRPCSWCPAQKCMRSGKPENAEINLNSPEGVKLRLQISAFPIRNEEGEVVQITELIKDLNQKPDSERDMFGW
jgi:PAS domain S-box-containing protein/excisionase family DNA binding protein